MLQLVLVVVGDNRPLVVEIEATSLVGVLQSKIKDAKTGSIRCDASHLELFLALKNNAWLSDNDPDLNGLSQPAEGNTVLPLYANDNKRMKTTVKLARYFSGGKYPEISDEADGIIHVVVVVPTGVLPGPPTSVIAMAPTSVLPSVVPSICVTELLQNNSAPHLEFMESMKQPLGFKIPVLVAQYVSTWPDSFIQGNAEYGVCIDEYLEGTIVGTSESAVVSLDSLWLKLFMCLCKCTIFRDESHASSSRPGLRPDAVIVKGNVLVGKCEAKASEKQIATATLELTEKMADAAYTTFPRGRTCIPAWTTCAGLIQLHQLSYNPHTNIYESKILEMYHTTNFNDRQRFVVDLFKILKWVTPIEQPNALMHLFPQLRNITPNGHYVTWLKAGLVKEFRKNAEIDMTIIHRVYNANLQHVERGVCGPISVTITSIGQTLQNALVNFQGNRDSIVRQVQTALEELHNIGVAHCDVRAANVFVLLGDNRVILGDLEYCRPLDASPPNVKCCPKDGSCKTALELDEYQFRAFVDELARM
ncbi:Aste57867_24195 [Aphanomyces stellatus]|uniref:Aste57867_24195 protein n=1 Tax=Aphanomyces stellatus TaxID=120398 RepID=A0A485LQV9_9STRA|nr:hypothetical protein As57867_024121 [Aphanomyces stellatus]VFU00837.1 Aste57867_24195 [Aphanomyces stellatus]